MLNCQYCNCVWCCLHKSLDSVSKCWILLWLSLTGIMSQHFFFTKTTHDILQPKRNISAGIRAVSCQALKNPWKLSSSFNSQSPPCLIRFLQVKCIYVISKSPHCLGYEFSWTLRWHYHGSSSCVSTLRFHRPSKWIFCVQWLCQLWQLNVSCGWLYHI